MAQPSGGGDGRFPRNRPGDAVTACRHGRSSFDCMYFQRGRITTRKGISPRSREPIVATARSIARRAYAPDRNLWIGVHHIPDASGVLGCAPGAGAQGRRRRHRVGATDIHKRMPDLPYDQGRRQSLGPKPPQYHRKKSRFASELRLFQCHEGRGVCMDKEKLDHFIAKPDEVVPGNNMKPYGGLTSAEDRARVIVFLESPTTN